MPLVQLVDRVPVRWRVRAQGCAVEAGLEADGPALGVGDAHGEGVGIVGVAAVDQPLYPVVGVRTELPVRLPLLRRPPPRTIRPVMGMVSPT